MYSMGNIAIFIIMLILANTKGLLSLLFQAVILYMAYKGFNLYYPEDLTKAIINGGIPLLFFIPRLIKPILRTVNNRINEKLKKMNSR